MKEVNTIICGDALEVLKTFPNESIDMVMTSPPYWALRTYNVEGQLGLEPTFQEYINKLCNIFDEVKRVLKKEGTCWVNMGDTYMGNSSYSEKGRQGYGNDKIGMINKKQWLDPKYPHKEKLRAREHIKKGQVKEKSLCQIPARFATEMANRGWILRNEIIWAKPNCMPSSVKDRFTVDFEKLFFFVKSKKYYFEQQREPNKDISIKRAKYEQGRNVLGKNPSSIGYKSDKYGMPERFIKLHPDGHNKRAVWTINTKSFSEAHFATYPPELCETPIKAGCPKGGIILDPFFGAGTTGLVAQNLNRNYLGIELNKEYIKIAKKRLNQKLLL